jgi:hypothetical protein
VQDKGKQEIQGDKDQHLQVFTNEKTRIIQQIQTEANEAMQCIKEATAKTLANIQAKEHDSETKPSSEETRIGQ